MDKERVFLSNYINKEIITIPNQLNEQIYFKGTKFKQRNEFNQIKKYIDEFLGGNPFNRFLVLPGLRSVGKSTLLFQVYDYLLRDRKIAPNQILYFSCEDINYLGNYNIKDVVDLYLKEQFEKELRTLDKNIFLLIDESQYDKNWSLAGKIIYDKTQKIFMIFTGSSALNLEINADAARRMMKIDIDPLTYNQHLQLKYNISFNNSNLLEKIIFEANTADITKYEHDINTKLINTIDYTSDDWNNYFMYGGFPTLFYINNMHEQQMRLTDMIYKIINNDIPNIRNFNTENQTNIFRLLSFLALQRSNDISYDKISKHLQTSKSNIKNILDTLEKSHLIFHIEAYGTSSRRMKKAWKYYFATSSLKNAIASMLGNTSIQKQEYEGILLENYIASILHNFTSKNIYHYLYYDSNKENVDFLVKKEFENPIPIEVGRGKKDKKQVKTAINKYNSPHGIIISNTTNKIYKEENIIYIPYRTFSLI